MNQNFFDKSVIYAFNKARNIYQKFHGRYSLDLPKSCNDPIRVNDHIRNLLESPAPCMISRFGNNELECTVFGRNRLRYKYNLLTYIKGESDIWFYTSNIRKKMQFNAGFFSATDAQFDRFSQMMIDSMPLIDVLGSWCKEESYFDKELSNAFFVNLELLNPLWATESLPWTVALEGKKVLVVHPFSHTIEHQYSMRSVIHKNPLILPDFELKTLKAIQTIAGEKPQGFSTWFDALKSMEEAIDQTDFDICIIGCGAYGMPLAAHCKKMGKKAIHLGGATQLLFGIKGRRWEDDTYGFNGIAYNTFFTEFWVRPTEAERPQNASKIEDGCYW